MMHIHRTQCSIGKIVLHFLLLHTMWPMMAVPQVLRSNAQYKQIGDKSCCKKQLCAHKLKVLGDAQINGDLTVDGHVAAHNGLIVDGQLTQNHRIYSLTSADIVKRSHNGLPDERYDIIIVGAGTAGSLLTLRLAERYPFAKILVLDVGQDDVRISEGFPDNLHSCVPNPNPNNGAGPDAWGQLLRDFASAYGEGCAQWQQNLVTMVEDQFFRVPIQLARGATLGGTSAINARIWNRGTKKGTYDRWVDATGDVAFGFDAMVDTYKKIENRSQTTRYFGSAPIPYWFDPVGPTPGQTLNDEMGLHGRIYLTSYFLPGYTARAFEDAVTEAPLPGRKNALEVNLADVDVTNPVECGVLMPFTNYDQSDPNFPLVNPYLPSAPDFIPTPGTTYTPPADPANGKGPEYAGSGIKQLWARAYAAPAFLYPIIDNKIPHNVIIKERAYVTRLLFDGEQTNEVIGVEYVEGENGQGWQVAQVNRAIDRNVPPYKGTLSASNPFDPYLTETRSLCSFDAAVVNQATIQIKNAFAKADIWICAGAIDSPALLLRSGIGPRDELEALRTQPVDVRVQLPGVGSSVQDSMDMGLTYFTEIDLSTGLPAPFPAATVEFFYPAAFGFADPTSLLNVSGTASIGGSATKPGFILRGRSNSSKPFNDFDLLPCSTPFFVGAGSLLYQDFFNISTALGLHINFDTIKPVFDRARWGMYSPKATSEYLQYNTSIVEYWDLKSQGQVTINSGNLFERPLYAPNMGADEDDLVAMANIFENTVLPLWQRCASKRFGPRGIATYAGGVFASQANTITFGVAGFGMQPFGPFPLKPIVGNITPSEYDIGGALVGFSIEIVSGAGSGQTNVITEWTGAPLYTATVLFPWDVVPGLGDSFILNPPEATPLDSVAFEDDNHRNFVRLAHPNGDEIFSEVAIVQLSDNPFVTKANSTRIRIHQPNHGYATGDMIKIAGVTHPVNGSPANNFNDYHIVYVLDADSYDIILFWNVTPLEGPGSSSQPSPAPTFTGVGGGSTVTVSTLRFDEKKFRTWLKSHYYSGWHPCCSCRMGKIDDTMAVVDTRARVYDTKGLRISDCSIFPIKPNANTQAPAYGITQRLFDLISIEEYDHLL